MIKSDCYKIKTLHFNDGLFDDCVSATYVIHLTGNGRETQIYSNLAEIHPTGTVHIVYNEGFKKCDKGSNVKDSVADLTNTYLWIFKDALKQNYTNILILEDDFIFDKEIKNPKHIHSIQQFINNKANQEFCYLIGCLPFLMVPRNSHCYNVFSCGTHCVIYSNPLIKRISTMQPHDIGDWDIFMQFNTVKIAHYKPLCYQLFPVTENMNNWGNASIIMKLCAIIFITYFKLLSLQNSVHPGYDIAYFIAKMLWWIIVLLIAFALYKVVKWFRKRR